MPTVSSIGNVRVDAVQVVKVDDVRLKALQSGMAGLLHVVAAGRPGGCRLAAKLGGDFHVVAPDGRGRLAENLLVPQQLPGNRMLRYVGLSRVEERTAGVHRALNEFDGFSVGHRGRRSRP